MLSQHKVQTVYSVLQLENFFGYSDDGDGDDDVVDDYDKNEAYRWKSVTQCLTLATFVGKNS